MRAVKLLNVNTLFLLKRFIFTTGVSIFVSQVTNIRIPRMPGRISTKAVLEGSKEIPYMMAINVIL